MLLIVMQWICHCVQLQIDSVGVFVWALAPFFGFVLFSAVCFAVSAGETQVFFLAGARCLSVLAKRKSGWGICGSSFFGVVVVFVLLLHRFAYSKDFLSLYRVLTAYSHVRIEPLVRHRPHSRKKTTTKKLVSYFWVIIYSFVHLFVSYTVAFHH